MYEEASQVANDAVGSIRTVASFNAESKVMDMYQKKCSGPEKQGVRSGLVSGAGFGFSFVALYCMSAFCFYIGSVLVQHGKATFQEVFKVQQLLNQLKILKIYLIPFCHSHERFYAGFL
jgi:ATP-binding cassette, subfamily B (MDR/TAP), member 1